MRIIIIIRNDNFLTRIDEAISDTASVNTNLKFHVRRQTTDDKRRIEHIKIGHTVTTNLKTSSDAYRRHSDSFRFGLLSISIHSSIVRIIQGALFGFCYN